MDSMWQAHSYTFKISSAIEFFALYQIGTVAKRDHPIMHPF